MNLKKKQTIDLILGGFGGLKSKYSVRHFTTSDKID